MIYFKVLTFWRGGVPRRWDLKSWPTRRGLGSWELKRAVDIFAVKSEAAGLAAKPLSQDSHTSSSFLQPPLAFQGLSPVFTDHLLPGNPLGLSPPSPSLILSNLLFSSPNKKDGLQPYDYRPACSSPSLSTVCLSIEKDHMHRITNQTGLPFTFWIPDTQELFFFPFVLE